MIPLILAQAAATPVAKSIFENDTVKGGVLILVLGILGWIARSLNTLRTVRQDVTAEITMQQRENERKENVGRFPQPLEVKAHIGHVTMDKHNALQKQMDELKEQRRKDVAGLHLKIEGGVAKLRSDIAEEFKEVREEGVQSRLAIAGLETQANAQAGTLNRMQNTLEAMPEKIVKLINPS